MNDRQVEALALDSAALEAAGRALCFHTPLFIDGFGTATSIYSEESRERWRKAAIEAARVVVSAYVAIARTPSASDVAMREALRRARCYVVDDIKRKPTEYDPSSDLAFIDAALSASEAKTPHEIALEVAIKNGAAVHPRVTELKAIAVDREAVARIVCYWDQRNTCRDNICVGSCHAVKPDDWCFKAADAVIALHNRVK